MKKRIVVHGKTYNIEIEKTHFDDSRNYYTIDRDTWRGRKEQAQWILRINGKIIKSARTRKELDRAATMHIIFRVFDNKNKVDRAMLGGGFDLDNISLKNIHKIVESISLVL